MTAAVLDLVGKIDQQSQRNNTIHVVLGPNGGSRQHHNLVEIDDENPPWLCPSSLFQSTLTDATYAVLDRALRVGTTTTTEDSRGATHRGLASESR
jgi:hypothetical protein